MFLMIEMFVCLDGVDFYVLNLDLFFNFSKWVQKFIQLKLNKIHFLFKIYKNKFALNTCYLIFRNKDTRNTRQ